MSRGLRVSAAGLFLLAWTALASAALLAATLAVDLWLERRRAA